MTFLEMAQKMVIQTLHRLKNRMAILSPSAFSNIFSKNSVRRHLNNLWKLRKILFKAVQRKWIHFWFIDILMLFNPYVDKVTILNEQHQFLGIALCHISSKSKIDTMATFYLIMKGILFILTMDLFCPRHPRT